MDIANRIDTLLREIDGPPPVKKVLTTLEIPDKVKIDLINEAKSLKSNINALKKNLLKREELIVKADAALVDLDNKSLKYLLKNPNISKNIRTRLKSFLVTETAHELRCSSENKKLLRVGKESQVSLGVDLSRNKRKLKVHTASYKERIFNINDIRIALSSLPFVDNEKTELIIKLPKNILRVFFKGLICTPDIVVARQIEDTSWILPDLYIDIDLSTGKSRVYPAETGYAVCGYDGYYVHPHILSGNHPCYGDFLSSISGVVTTDSVLDVVIMTQLFLEQAAVDDIAGSYFFRHMFTAGCTPEDRETYSDVLSRLNKHEHNGRTIYLYKVSSEKWLLPTLKDGQTTFLEFNTKLDAYTAFDKIQERPL